MLMDEGPWFQNLISSHMVLGLAGMKRTEGSRQPLLNCIHPGHIGQYGIMLFIAVPDIFHGNERDT